MVPAERSSEQRMQVVCLLKLANWIGVRIASDG